MTRTVRSARRAAVAALAALAALAAIIAADFTVPISAQSGDTTGRIVSRLLDDGRVEFGWQPTGGARTLPTKRYFPATIDHNRWLRSSPVEVDGAEIGRINARLSEDGRIEFAFTPTDRERIEPLARYFPAGARVGRWLRSTEITIPASDGERATSDDGERATSSDEEHATSTDGEQASSSDEEHATNVDDERATSSDGERATSDDGERTTSADEEQATSSDDEHAISNDGAFTAVSAGGEHTCGLRESGAIECWGNNNYGQSDAPEGSFTAVSAGRYHSCGLRKSGAIECWGAGGAGFSGPYHYGQSDAPEGDFTAVSAGDSHTCGLRESGAIECWGASGAGFSGPYHYGQSDAPEGDFTAVSAGDSHTCGLRESGTIECWGYNKRGQSDAPEGDYTAVSAGGYHSCGLRESGAIECWGQNGWGQTDAPAGSYSAVSAGGWHTCGLLESGEIECWGENEEGQNEDPAVSFTAVSAGRWHTCGLLENNGAIECWGSSSSGQTATPRVPGQLLPIIPVLAVEDGVTEAQLSEVRQQMAAIVRWFAARWGAVATPPGRVLVGKTRPETAPEEHCAAAAGNTIYYFLDCPGAHTLAHEYAHIAQNHPGSAYAAWAPGWMSEGMAEWMAIIYSSQNGGPSYQVLQSSIWRSARQVRNQNALDDPSLPHTGHDALYTMGVVATERLAQLAGEQAIFDFWPNLRRARQNGQGVAEAFAATFGITLADFYATFDAYLNGARPSIRIAPND